MRAIMKKAVIAAMALAAVACVSTPNRAQLKLHRSATQLLVFENSGAETLYVYPQKNESAPPLPVPPGGDARIEFVVLSIADIQIPEGETRYEQIPGTTQNLVLGLDSAGYIYRSGPEAILRVGASEELKRPWRLSVDRCPGSGWTDGKAPPARHTIDLAAPPLPGVPSRLCPK